MLRYSTEYNQGGLRNKMVNFEKAVQLAKEGNKMSRCEDFYMTIEEEVIVFRNDFDNGKCDIQEVTMEDIDQDWKIYREEYEEDKRDDLEGVTMFVSDNGAYLEHENIKYIDSKEKELLQIEFNHAVNKLSLENTELRNKLEMDTNYLAGYGPTIPINQWLDMILQNGGDKFE